MNIRTTGIIGQYPLQCKGTDLVTIPYKCQAYGR